MKRITLTVRRALMIFTVLCILFSASGEALGESNPYAASYKTYDTTYDDILKMYLRVMPAQCREQSRRRHDLYNELMYDDIPFFMDDLDTEEYRQADEAAKQKIRSSAQEKALQYMKNNIGYAIRDLNDDGIDEMIIGMGKAYVFEVFTMDEGKVRELIKAGYRDPCLLLADGTFFRRGSMGAGMHPNSLFRMNGTGKVQFVKGYLDNLDYGYQIGLGNEDCWFRMTKENDTVSSMDKHVPRSEAEAWISECESNLSDIRFIPFAAYEKGMSGDGIGILAKGGKTTGGQKIRIRSKPDGKSKILAQKKVGTFVKAVCMDGDYYQVTVDKKTGYIHKDYLILLTDLPDTGEAE